MKRFLYKEQYLRPEVQRISDGVIMRLEHIYEVDPALMESPLQAAEHAAMGHRADRREQERPPVLDARPFRQGDPGGGRGSELDLGPGQPVSRDQPSYPESSAKHPPPILPW